MQFRGQTLAINGSAYPIPTTSLGICYMIYNLDLQLKNVKNAPGSVCPSTSVGLTSADSHISSIADALHNARHELADSEYLSKVYALYAHLYQKCNSAKRLPIDSGHQDALAINNCVKYIFPSHTRCVLRLVQVKPDRTTFWTSRQERTYRMGSGRELLSDYARESAKVL